VVDIQAAGKAGVPKWRLEDARDCVTEAFVDPGDELAGTFRESAWALGRLLKLMHSRLSRGKTLPVVVSYHEGRSCAAQGHAGAQDSADSQTKVADLDTVTFLTTDF
jgi:hypothetical protein